MKKEVLKVHVTMRAWESLPTKLKKYKHKLHSHEQEKWKAYTLYPKNITEQSKIVTELKPTAAYMALMCDDSLGFVWSNK